MQYVLTEKEYKALKDAALPLPPDGTLIKLDAPIPLENCIKIYIQAVLALCDDNESRTARILKVHRQTVRRYRKMK